MKNNSQTESDDLKLDDSTENEENKVILKTHEMINRDLSGEILELKKGFVKLELTTTEEMVADEQGLIHGGFIFSAADYAAMAAVNEKNVVLVASETSFLAPVKFGDLVKFTAKVRHKEGRKRNVHVVAHILDIKVFEGEFKTVITDRHVLKLKLLDETEK